MLFLLSEIIVIISYLFNDKLGMICSILIYSAIFLNKKYSFIDKILISLIFSIPTFNIGFASKNMSHVLSWCTIFLVFFIICMFYNFIKGKCKMHKKIIFLCILVLGISFSNCFFEKNVSSAIFEWFQVCLMIIPLIFIWEQKDYLKDNIKVDHKYIDFINNTIIATAICVILQYSLYQYLGIKVGRWTFYSGRTMVDLLFDGSSVLSLYLGIAIPINVIKIYKKFNLKNILFVIICIIAIIINTSRTGLVSGITVSAVIIMKKFSKTKKSLIMTICCIPFVVMGMMYGIEYLLQSRETTSLLDLNGRNETYIYGFSVFSKSMKNILFGAGLSLDNYTYMLPHNFVLETLVTMGIINTVIIVSMILKVLNYIKEYEYKYAIWSVFVGSMFITNFQGNVFQTVHIIVAILIATKIKNIDEGVKT